MARKLLVNIDASLAPAEEHHLCLSPESSQHEWKRIQVIGGTPNLQSNGHVLHSSTALDLIVK